MIAARVKVLQIAASTLVLLAAFCCQSLDASQSGEGEVKIFSLKYASCKAMAVLLDDLSQGELTTAIDERTNSLVLLAPQESLTVIESILTKLDRPVDEHTPADARTAGKTANAASARQVKSPAEAVVVSVVDDGTPVKQGETILVLQVLEKADSAEQKLDQELADAHERIERDRYESQLRADAQTAERLLRLGERRLKYAQAENQLEQARLEHELANAEGRYGALRHRADVLQQQFSSGKKTGEELELSRFEAAAAERAIQLCRQQLEIHQQHAAPLRVMEAEVHLREAQTTLNAAQADLERFQASEAAAEKARAEFKQDSQRATRPVELKIGAPTGGIVRHVTPLKEGSRIRAKQPVLVLEELAE